MAGHGIERSCVSAVFELGESGGLLGVELFDLPEHSVQTLRPMSSRKTLKNADRFISLDYEAGRLLVLLGRGFYRTPITRTVELLVDADRQMCRIASR
ncbi:hypothetical protein FHR84_003508 [Actinopolyspora biskrensis]|uniref:Uncharacterized protein n=1 Tax=Actinopolyspora biskrensis TaxID=1470178 RepID=A0A852Z317_9ACTN|nr:hypothetical protein [Actinopolyspora biskrensis]NYH80159.1 hypothetical protein [Actinopolyspora biskrensis]